MYNWHISEDTTNGIWKFSVFLENRDLAENRVLVDNVPIIELHIEQSVQDRTTMYDGDQVHFVPNNLQWTIIDIDCLMEDVGDSYSFDDISHEILTLELSLNSNVNYSYNRVRIASLNNIFSPNILQTQWRSLNSRPFVEPSFVPKKEVSDCNWREFGF